jgi:outer membrane protein OmpA-like peptidoglycan-associated protein
MFGMRVGAQRRTREEGEKPFWISFSDLMSALMVLFLVAMSVALLAVTKKISEDEREDKERLEAITQLMDEVRKVLSAKEFEGVRVVDNTIDFGPRGTFEREGQNTLSPAQRALLLQFTPRLLDKLRTSEAGKPWFKRAVVEGYASQSGTYLLNLNLSLERSARVICELLRVPGTGEAPLSLEDRKLVATKFFVGGASFNSLRTTAEDSRRIEFKLEFKSRQERREEKAKPTTVVDEARLLKALDPLEACPLKDRLGG